MIIKIFLNKQSKPQMSLIIVRKLGHIEIKPLTGSSQNEINTGNHLMEEKRKEEKYICRKVVLVNSSINRTDFPLTV